MSRFLSSNAPATAALSSILRAGLEMATFDPEDFPHNQSISNHSPCLRGNLPKGLMGYIHHPGSRFLAKPLLIRKPDRLKPLHGKEGDLDESAADRCIPRADLVAITGTAFTNHTVDRLF